MTRKQFNIMAQAVAALANDNERAASAKAFAEILAKTNPRFDKAKWFKACNVSQD